MIRHHLRAIFHGAATVLDAVADACGEDMGSPALAAVRRQVQELRADVSRLAGERDMANRALAQIRRERDEAQAANARLAEAGNALVSEYASRCGVCDNIATLHGRDCSEQLLFRCDEHRHTSAGMAIVFGPYALDMSALDAWRKAKGEKP